MRIDLHTHSRVSDGTDSPSDLVAGAAQAGLDVVALTDHDTCAGWDEAFAAGEAHGVGIVPGMELSTTHEGHGVHLLAYLHDPTFPPLVAELERILDGREARLGRMVSQLNDAGIELSIDDVLAETGHAVSTGRPHVADALVRLGVVTDRAEAFQHYLGWGKPGHVRRYAPTVTTMIDLISRAGGVSVIAHPWGRTRAGHGLNEAGFARLADLGLSGIEVDHQDHDPEMRDQLRSIATNLGLLVTGSSDYHGEGKKDHDLGVNTTSADTLAQLVDLGSAAAAASGRRTREAVLSWT